MLTIIGNGMGKYNFSNIDINFEQFDKIICDKNFEEDNSNILKFSYKDAKDYILENYSKKNLLYVVTGSPLFFSAGILIANKLPFDQVKIINNISSKDYILSKLFIDELKLTAISLHGRKNIDKTKFLTNEYSFVLCDQYSIKILQEALIFLNHNDIKVTIGYKLGYEDEVIEQINIFKDNLEFDLTQPYVIVIEKLYKDINLISQDDEFVTQRGMITKKYKRELSLQLLDLQPNEILWDIGAGSGSCGIQAYKRYKTKSIFFEKQPQRIVFIKENLQNHKVVDCKLYEGEAEHIFNTIDENPDKIFIGGGGEKVIEKIPYLYERLNKNGIILINAITLTHLSLMINILNKANIKYEVHSISLTTYKGSLNLVEPQRQLFSILTYK